MGKENNVNHYNEVMNQKIAEKTKVATDNEAKSKLGIDKELIYMKAESYIAYPDKLLGEVYLVKAKKHIRPTSLWDENVEFEKSVYPVPGIKVVEKSRLDNPILRQSIIVDKNLSAGIEFLHYLSVELTSNDYFSLMVYDQATGLLDTQDESWRNGIERWKTENADLMQDESICCIFAVTGFSQKNVIRKKYVIFEGKGKGGSFGININGKISTSTDEYSLDFRFGLQPAIIKRFSTSNNNMPLSGINIQKNMNLHEGVQNLNRNTDFSEHFSDIKYSDNETIKQLFKSLKGAELSKTFQIRQNNE